MRVLLTIASHELRVTLRRASFLAVTALLPTAGLVAVVVLRAMAGGEAAPEVQRAGYVDNSGLLTGYTRQADTEFLRYEDLDSGVDALLAGEVERLYYIPADYLATGAVVRYAVGQGLELAGGSDPDGALRGFVLDNLAGERLEPSLAARIKDPIPTVARATLDREGRPREIDPGRFIFFMGLSLLLVVSIFMSSGFLLQGVGEEKENRVMEVLLSSVTPAQIMVGKVLGLGGAGLAQMVLWLASGAALLRLAAGVVPDWPVTAPGALTLLGVLFFILGYLLFATLMAGLGAVSATARESQQISGIFVVPAIVPIYMTPYLVAHPTDTAARVLTLFPLTSPFVVFQRLGVGAIGPWEVTASVIVLALSVAGAMLATVRVFRAYLLMYGRRPGLRELLRTLARR